MKYRSVSVLLLSISLMLGLTACDRGAEENASKGESDVKPQPAVAESESTQPGPVTGSEALPPGHPPFEGMPMALTAQQAASGDLPAGHPALPEVSELPESGIPEDEPEHPVPSDRDLALDLPDSIQHKWSAVALELTTADGGNNEIQVPLGGETQLQDLGLILRVDTFIPSYKSDFETITSASDALDNPAVKVILLENHLHVAQKKN